MNKFKTFIGIDVSKKTFDAAVLQDTDPQQICHQSFTQSAQGYSTFYQWLLEQGDTSQLVVCLEHTGIYINGLVEFLIHQGLAVWVEMPLRIKKCMGLQRGGNDKLAAMHIAKYAWRYRDEMRLWQPTDTNLEELRHYIAQRDRIVLALTQLSVPVKELAEVGQQKHSKKLARLQAQAIRSLEKSIVKIETAIGELIESDTKMKAIVERVSSIKGIGKQTAINLYVYTKGFTEFKNGKQLACYCGVVPFEKSSGTSVRYKPGVSPFANRKLKKLLHLCAMAAIRWNEDMKQYYERKVSEGKNKMSVINAVRNKLVLRIFAVVRDERIYVEKLYPVSV